VNNCKEVIAEVVAARPAVMNCPMFVAFVSLTESIETLLFADDV
jgi:hypothetical protein